MCVFARTHTPMCVCECRHKNKIVLLESTQKLPSDTHSTISQAASAVHLSLCSVSFITNPSSFPAFAVQAVFMVAAGYVMTKAAAITCLTVAVGIGGFAWSGFSVNHLDVAPQFASILMGLSNTFATLPGILSPVLTGAVVTDQVRYTGGWDRGVQCL